MATHGVCPSGHPYHRFGSGSQRLVVVPGVMDSLGWNTPRSLTAELLATYYFRDYDSYDVWVLSRPPGLPAGQTVAEMAAGYADVLEVIGPAHVLGISLGGCLAAHLARRRPELVDRLVVLSCGTRPGAYGRVTFDRWSKLAAARRYRELHVEYARTVYTGFRRVVVPPLYRLGGALLPEPQEHGDVETSCLAVRDFDGSDLFEAVEAPTLVVGGRHDVLFPVETARDATRRCQNGRLVTFDSGGAVYEEQRRAVANAVLGFLDESEK